MLFKATVEDNVVVKCVDSNGKDVRVAKGGALCFSKEVATELRRKFFETKTLAKEWADGEHEFEVEARNDNPRFNEKGEYTPISNSNAATVSVKRISADKYKEFLSDEDFEILSAIMKRAERAAKIAAINEKIAELQAEIVETTEEVNENV